LSIKSSTNGTAYSDFQCSSGFPYQINIDLTIRTKSEYGKNRLVNKKNYHPGNFNFSKNDKYQRDTFSTTVIARNL
jgi:hypothetical protein